MAAYELLEQVKAAENTQFLSLFHSHVGFLA